MNYYLAYMAQPWPLVNGVACETVIIQARDITRAVEQALKLGPVEAIELNRAIPVVVEAGQ
jgi:hypothetical protein